MTRLQIPDAGRLSHAYILSAPSREECLDAARTLAAAAVCSGGAGTVPCGKCRDCRKALTGIHPDVISLRRLLDDKGHAKKEIIVDQIRAISADSYILPNEAARKVYILEEADYMNSQAQNAALKLLEEPPAGVMFILCVENVQLLLPTVRSRCAELIIAGAEDAPSEEGRALAREFMDAVASGSAVRLCTFCFSHEGLDTRGAAEFVDVALALAADMLCGRVDARGLSRRQLMRLCELLRVCQARLKVNTGVKHILGLLAADAIAADQQEGKYN